MPKRLLLLALTLAGCAQPTTPVPTASPSPGASIAPGLRTIFVTAPLEAAKTGTPRLVAETLHAGEDGLTAIGEGQTLRLLSAIFPPARLSVAALPVQNAYVELVDPDDRPLTAAHPTGENGQVALPEGRAWPADGSLAVRTVAKIAGVVYSTRQPLEATFGDLLVVTLTVPPAVP